MVRNGAGYDPPPAGGLEVYVGQWHIQTRTYSAHSAHVMARSEPFTEASVPPLSSGLWVMTAPFDSVMSFIG